MIKLRCMHDCMPVERGCTCAMDSFGCTIALLLAFSLDQARQRLTMAPIVMSPWQCPYSHLAATAHRLDKTCISTQHFIESHCDSHAPARARVQRRLPAVRCPARLRAACACCALRAGVAAIRFKKAAGGSPLLRTHVPQWGTMTPLAASVRRTAP